MAAIEVISRVDGRVYAERPFAAALADAAAPRPGETMFRRPRRAGYHDRLLLVRETASP